MEKQTQLSKREKVLLVVAGILLLGYLSINFLISPTLKRYNKLTNENEELQWRKQEVSMYEGSIDNNQKILSKVKYELLSKSSNFSDKVDTLKVDEEITTLLQSNGITPIAVQLENGIKIEKQEKENTANNNSSNNTINKDTAKKNEPEALPSVYKFKVNVQASGSIENAKKVIDIVSKSSDRRIVKLDVAENDKTVLNFTFIVYVRDSFSVYNQ